MPRRAILIVLVLGVIVLLGLAWKWTVVRSGPVLSEDEDHPLAGDAAELVAPARPLEAMAVESRREAESQPSGEQPTPAAPFRGQVVDAATGEPVPDALVVAGSFQAMAEVEGMPRAVLFGVRGLSRGEAGPLPAIKGMTDAEGRFVADRPLPDSVDQVSVMNPFHRSHIRSLPRECWVPLPEPEGWQFPIAIGPTFPLRIHGADTKPLEAWRARLVTPLQPPEDDGGWVRLNPGDPPFLRYDNPVDEHAEGTRFFVEVRSEDGLLGGSVEVFSVVGIHPQVLDVWVDELTVLTGRVVDAEGKGRECARILAVAVKHVADRPRILRHAETDAEGVFQLVGLEPGRYWLEASWGRAGPEQLELDVPAGPSSAPDIVIDLAPAAGAIRGRLVSRSGARIARAVLRLRAVRGEYERWESLSAEEQDEWGGGSVVDAFSFDDVPGGEYELSIVSSQELSWSPTSILVSPPSQDLLFVREDEVEFQEYVVRALDAVTGEPLRRVVVLLYAPGDSSGWGVGYDRPFGSLPAHARLRWTVSAEDYIPVHGDERSFVPEGERRVVTLKLSRGFGVRLILRDCQGRLGPVFGEGHPLPESPPVSGAEVLADGVAMGTSDANGIVDLALPQEPERIEIRLPGWSVLGSPQFRDGRVLGEGALAPVWLRRD